MDSPPEYDLGPLSWVQAEIDQALNRGLESLAAFRAKPEDAAALTHARSHVHQAAGAIQMVGLDAVVAFTDELERQLGRLPEVPAAELPPACGAIERGCRKLRIFLDELINGAPPLPLKLFPEYEAMQRVRGVKAAPTDLFYPDLSPRAPKIAPRELIAPAKLPSYLVKQRRLYQRGLLSWLRGGDDNQGARDMRAAVAGVEDVTNHSSMRAFWWTSGALLEALAENGLSNGFGVKQLAARIDLQIRRVAEGSGKVSDRLRREVLYFVAISAPVGPQVQAVQRAFKLTGLIPSPEVLSADVVRLQPILRDARDQLAGAKDAWLKVASGRAENLPKLKQMMASVHARAAEVHHGPLMKLTASLVERLGKMPASGVPEPVAMEYATALLLAESAFENYTSLSPDFPKQVDSMLARLDAARSGRIASGAPTPTLDEMSRRAQERVLMAQVGREIQANLRHMEQVLDAFFRDNGKRSDLVALTKDSQQIRGALRMLGLDEADRLLALCQEQIESYANPKVAVDNDDLELLAESLSGLGFYIEAVEQQRPDRERLIAPLIARRVGEVPPLPANEESETVEAAVEELRTALPQLVSDMQRAPADATAREDLRQKLTGLRDDAELIGDRDLLAQTSSMLKELASGDTATLTAAAEAISDVGERVPEISAETARLLATDATGLDGELLEIFLAEAVEVLDTIAGQHAVLQSNPGDREALQTVRRGFHTLKGSGRMVGLTQLGDVAYEVEKIHNRLLDEERPVTSAVVAMIGVAQSSFSSWVGDLTSTGRVTADPQALYASLAAVEREFPGASRKEPATQIPSNVIELSFPQAAASPATAAPTNAAVASIAPVAPIARPASPPVLELVELPELGTGADDDFDFEPPVDFDSLETEDIELVEITPPEEVVMPPMLRLVESNASTVDDAVEEIPTIAEIAPTAAPVEFAASDDRTAGDPQKTADVFDFAEGSALRRESSARSDVASSSTSTIEADTEPGLVPVEASGPASTIELDTALGLAPFDASSPAPVMELAPEFGAELQDELRNELHTGLRNEVGAPFGVEVSAEPHADFDIAAGADLAPDVRHDPGTGLSIELPTVLRIESSIDPVTERSTELGAELSTEPSTELSTELRNEPSDELDALFGIEVGAQTQSETGIAPAADLTAAAPGDLLADLTAAPTLATPTEESFGVTSELGTVSEGDLVFEDDPDVAAQLDDADAVDGLTIDEGFADLATTPLDFAGDAHAAHDDVAKAAAEDTDIDASGPGFADADAFAKHVVSEVVAADTDGVLAAAASLRESPICLPVATALLAAEARAAAQADASVAAADAQVEQFVQTAGPVAGAIDPPREPEPENADEGDITIGDVTLSMLLWKILCDEADVHLATLEHELSRLRFDSVGVPSPEMVRASHTLCGIHRTGGFPLVADTAKAVEQVLIALEQRGSPLPGSALPVLAHAVSGLTHFCGRVKARSPFTPSDWHENRIILAEIEDLRAHAAFDSSDAESEAEEIARREDEHTPTLALVTSNAMVRDDAPPPEGAAEFTPPAPVLAAVEPPPAAPAEVHLPRPVADPLAQIRDDVDVQVLPIFLDEAAELFPQAGEDLRAWRRDANLAGPPAQLRRTLHTLKGSARMAGAMRLGELAHLMESRLSDGDDPVPASPALFDALEGDLDQIAFVLDHLRMGKVDVPLPGFAASAQAPAPVAPAAIAAPIAADTQPTERPIVVPMAAAAAAPVAARTEATPELETGARAQLRVRADTIDRLVNEAGEVAIARARVEGELRALKGNLLELTGSVIRLRGQMREIEIQAESQIQSQMTIRQEAESEFDPLEFDRYTRFQELTRSLAEGINDVSTVQQSLLKNLDDADAALAAQARLSRDVQQRLFAIRTVPFGSLSERLYRIMRTTAKELDKRANLEIHGAQVELDRSVLEKLAGPLEHLLRNALDHGLETRDARIASGKSETGEISLTVRQVGNEVVIDLADDGSGVDFGRVRERARSLGLFAADATPNEAQLVECLFHPGFSTASKVTQISGRGIGMDVVRSEVAALGGRVEVTTESGKGTRFTLTLPLTLAVAQAVLIRAGGRLWALPAPMVEQVQQVKADVLLDLYVRRTLQWQGRDYPFHYLPRLLGDVTHKPETVRYNPILLLRSGQTRAAIHVDEMVGNQEVVVKNIGPQLARVSGISGATVLGTGEIVLIINPVQLAARADVPVFDPSFDERVVGERPRAPTVVEPTLPVVLIVDDSLTVRKITSRLLTREGFAVLTAKDGVDALQVLVEHTPDVILLDIEMPRMDGFEFAKTIKVEPKTARIPIVMITSRTADKHRNRAAELGVDLYLGKPYQEEELLRNLREMLSLPMPA